MVQERKGKKMLFDRIVEIDGASYGVHPSVQHILSVGSQTKRNLLNGVKNVKPPQ